MNRPLTKYILFLPLSYLGYCYYENLKEKTAKQELANHSGNPNSLNSEYARFRKCKTTLELANILKKSLKYVRTQITEPYNINPELQDCEVIDSGEGSGQWWSYPYHTKSTLKVNRYNYLDGQKLGNYSLLFWTGLKSKQRLRLSNTGDDEEMINQMISKRENKCHQIAKHSSPTSNIQYQNFFVECLRKTEGASKLLEKEFERIKLIKNYKKWM